MSDRNKRVARWYFGGLASAGAAIITHPIDLIKVHLQTQQKGKISIIGSMAEIVRKQGVRALYNGISASMLRQLTYSTTRFGIYEVAKQNVDASSFAAKVGLAGVAGAAGGFIGTPGDMINVRMQNDIKLPKEMRRNYKHAIDGVIRVCTEEGFTKLFGGASSATARAVLMTIGQLSFYDLIKGHLLTSGYFDDNLTTHFLASLSAGIIATTITQPIDVIKTRAMNAKEGEYSGNLDIARKIAENGPKGFYKGYIPSLARILPGTIFIFIFFEQLRLNFGYIPEEKLTTRR